MPEIYRIRLYVDDDCECGSPFPPDRIGLVFRRFVFGIGSLKNVAPRM